MRCWSPTAAADSGRQQLERDFPPIACTAHYVLESWSVGATCEVPTPTPSLKANHLRLELSGCQRQVLLRGPDETHQMTPLLFRQS